MNPNDPNSGNGNAPQDPGAVNPSDLTLDALYGPSTPGAESAPAAQPPLQQDQTAPIDQSAMPPLPEQYNPAPLPPTDIVQNFNQPQEPMADTMPPAPTDQMDQTGYAQPAQDYTEQPAAPTDATSFYQTVDPQQYGTDQSQGMAAEMPDDQYAIAQEDTVPQPDQSGMPPVPPTPDQAPLAAPGALPPVPSRSKLPLIIMGVVVVLIVLLGATFLLLRGLSPKSANTPSPIATATPADNPCTVDPTADGCEGSPVPQSSSGDFASPTPGSSINPSSSPAASSGPSASYTPQQCQLLFGGTCPQ